MGGAKVSKNDLKYINAMGSHPDPVLTAPELADVRGVSQQAAYNKLSSFRDRGLVKSKKVGARSVVWWLTTDGTDIYRDASASDP